MNLTCFVVLLALVGALAAAPGGAQEQRALVPSITVVGSGQAAAKPDLAQIQVGVVTQAATASAALRDNSELMDKLLTTLKARGIEERDVQTSNFSVAPQYRPNPQPQQRPEIVGFQASNEVRIRVRKLDLLGALLDELGKAGANQMHGISFSVAEPSRILDRAREEAMRDARRKAELYAGAAGVKVGRVLLIQEQTPMLPGPRGFAPGGLTAMAQAVPVATGEQEFHVSITVTYAIE